MDNTTVNFMLPGMYEHFDLNMRLINLLKTAPEMFYPGVQIRAAYGNFQFCIFDGGRIFTKYRHTNREEMTEIVKAYNDANVPVRLIFTNPVIEEKMFKNRFGQAMLEVCNNPLNEIVINNEKLEQYVRENYKDFSYISSTTKCLNTPDKFKTEFAKDGYTMVCLDYNLNHNWKMLENIPEADRNRCEFLVNAICPAGCPNRKDHYRLNGLFSLTYGKPYAISSCPIDESTLHPTQCSSVNNLSPEEIYNKYVPNGFCNFKLEGRTLGILENACNYVRYMVKPEYQFYALTCLIDEDPGEKVYHNFKTAITSL